jgi:hypothetical protein
MYLKLLRDDGLVGFADAEGSIAGTEIRARRVMFAFKMPSGPELTSWEFQIESERMHVTDWSCSATRDGVTILEDVTLTRAADSP